MVDPLTLGTGVTLQSINSVRDPILKSSIQQETQTQGQLGAQVSALQQTQVNFTTSTSDIGTEIANFFDSINQLSANPSDLSVRQGVSPRRQPGFEFQHHGQQSDPAADQPRPAWSRPWARLTSSRNRLRSSTARSAILKAQERVRGASSTSASRPSTSSPPCSTSRHSQRPQPDPDHGQRHSAGHGQQSFQLQTQPNAAGLHQVYAQGADITSQITSGRWAEPSRCGISRFPRSKTSSILWPPDSPTR